MATASFCGVVFGCALVLTTVETQASDATTIFERARNAIEMGGSRIAEFTLEVETPSWHAIRCGRIFKQCGADGRRTLIVFDDPAQVEGVKLLSWQPKDGPTAQWLYTPGTHRARRIAAGETARSVFGTDFRASDLELRSGRLVAVLTNRESRDGHDAYVVEITGWEHDLPVHERLWIRAGDHRVARREFYADGRLQRVYTVDELQTIDGIPTPVRMTVENLAAQSRSRIRLKGIRYKAELDPALFTIQQMDSRIAETPYERGNALASKTRE